MILQIAFKPQEPGHGSRHFSLMHAWLLGHSELIEHSGLQFGGAPMYVDKHAHDEPPLILRHSDRGPHGDGLHGSR